MVVRGPDGTIPSILPPTLLWNRQKHGKDLTISSNCSLGLVLLLLFLYMESKCQPCFLGQGGGMVLRVIGESGFSGPFSCTSYLIRKCEAFLPSRFCPIRLLQHKLEAQQSQAWPKSSSETGQRLQKELALPLLLLWSIVHFQASRPGLVSATAVLTRQASTLLPTSPPHLAISRPSPNPRV